MNAEAGIRVLLGEVDKQEAVLAKITAFYDDYLRTTSGLENRSAEQAIVVSEVFANYYTCLETLFLRISQFFENALSADRWHQDLLHKMTLRVEGVREAVVSDATAAVLLELLKFRHFKRYYFQFEYDWDQLDYLRKKFEQVRTAVTADLDRFRTFLNSLLP